MDISRASYSPKARLPKTRKPKRLQGFTPPPLGQRWPGHWPGQPGPILAEPGPSSRPAAASPLGPPLTISEVAELIGCSPWTVRQTLIPRGIPHFRFRASGRLTFYQGQVVRWIESQQQGGNKTK
jgi:hypothetical protein